MLAETTWDFGDFMLGVLWFFFLFIWIWLLITVFADVFRRHDIGGGAKTLWVVFVLLVPYLGVFIYLITQGHGMGERAQKQQAAVVEQMRQQIGYSAADELQKLDALHSQGKLSDEEYQQLRAKTLA
jgi:ABC-type multidrug transport system fused ATPase/permease subunit